MIICSQCGKDNQDHYKFCLGCGVELDRGASGDHKMQTAPHGSPADYDVEDQITEIGTRVVNPVLQDYVICPGCGLENASINRFCAGCGFRLHGSSRASSLGQVLLTALSPDGAEAGTYNLPQGTVTLGRDTGSVFAGDYYLSPRHATFTTKEEGLFVRDETSLNGVFRRLVADHRYPVRPGQIFRIGQELVKFEELKPTGVDEYGVEPMGAPSDGYVGRIAMVLGRNTTGTAFPIPETGLNLGRERGEVLFPDDGYVSGLHCRISYEGEQVYLTDLGSSNGTFVRLLEEEQITNGDILLMGQQLFRVTM